jgi:hypothetical protein
MRNARSMAPSPKRDLVLLHAEAGHFSCHSWQNIMFTCWFTRATGPAVQRIAELREVMDREHPEGLSVVYLIANDAGLPTPEARAGVSQLMTRYHRKRACLAIVVQGEGFWAGAMRAVITGVRMLTPEQFSMGVFSRVEQVAAWLPAQHLQRTGTELQRAEFLVILRQLVATL